MIKSVLIVVPHPDDEINVAGTVIDQLKKGNAEIYVLMCTYGDYYPKVTQKRFAEMKRAAALLGIPFKNYIFLGFGDGWKGECLYFAADRACSHAGKMETYALNEEAVDFSYIKNGYHVPYNRDSYKKSVMSVIADIKPDLIIGVDVDDHDDHKICSLMLDEAIGEIIKCDPEYRPLVLKKFAYMSVWNGKNDYFSAIPVESLGSGNTPNDSVCYPYLWDDRMCVKVSENLLGLDYWNNSVYKALNSYKTQEGKIFFEKVVNSDATYWYRSVNSLSYKAKVRVSSGEACVLNDFCIADVNICGRPSQKSWKPLDSTPWIQYNWDEIVSAEKIYIYLKPQDSAEQTVRIFGDETELMNARIAGNKNIIKIDLPLGTKVSSLRLSFESGNIAVTELEIYDGEVNVPWNCLPFIQGKTVLKRSKALCRMVFLVYRLDVLITSRIKRKLKFALRGK